MSALPAAGPALTVDLDAIVANYRLLQARVAPAAVAAVVKADAYGLGAVPVSRALAASGCTTFFVAYADEGAAIRPSLPTQTIYVLHGYDPRARAAFEAHRLVPAICTPEQYEAWNAGGLAQGFALHVDSGMSRLGLTAAELAQLAGRARPALVMSHLACSDEPEHPKNREQLARFTASAAHFPGARLSLSASGGCFLDRDFNFDLVRPGIALYGGNPRKDGPNPMRGAATLTAPLLQVRSIDRGESVGYGATYSASGPRRLAVAALGYADGLMRALSNRGYGVIAGVKCPIVGRVSMDLVTLDVSACPASALGLGAAVEFIGPGQSVDELARDAGTLPYEIYTRLGPRIERRYVGAS